MAKWVNEFHKVLVMSNNAVIQLETLKIIVNRITDQKNKKNIEMSIKNEIYIRKTI